MFRVDLISFGYIAKTGHQYLLRDKSVDWWQSRQQVIT